MHWLIRALHPWPRCQNACCLVSNYDGAAVEVEKTKPLLDRLALLLITALHIAWDSLPMRLSRPGCFVAQRRGQRPRGEDEEV